MLSERYSIKNYSPEDFEQICQYCYEADLLGTRDKKALSSLLKKKFQRPDYSPEEDIFLAKKEEKIVGLLEMIPELRIGRVIVSCFIHPSHRRKGLATGLFHHALRRAEKVEAEYIHVCVPEGSKAAKDFMEKLHFHPVRHFVELEASLPEELAEDVIHPLVRLDAFQSGEEARLTSIQNRCFTGSWGFCPNTEEEIRYFLGLTDSRLSDVLVLRLKKDERVVGYCWTHVLEGREDSAKKKGRIHMFGVDPDYRGKGLGRLILRQGLSFLRKKGTASVQLTVDKENRPAVSLYNFFHFKPIFSIRWYEKR